MPRVAVNLGIGKRRNQNVEKALTHSVRGTKKNTKVKSGSKGMSNKDVLNFLGIKR